MPETLQSLGLHCNIFYQDGGTKLQNYCDKRQNHCRTNPSTTGAFVAVVMQLKYALVRE